MALLYFIERTQHWLPFNPQKFTSVDPSLAWESTYPVRRARSTGRCNTLLKFTGGSLKSCGYRAYRFFNSQIGPSLAHNGYLHGVHRLIH